MSREAVEPTKPPQAALICTYGSSSRKPRLLDRDVIVIGKARQCDLALDAPEVAEVHCLVFRSGGGWQVRDCGSRIGTRVNGKSEAQAQLEDGDVIQVGRFAFAVQLPEIIHGAHKTHETYKPHEPHAEEVQQRLKECEAREAKVAAAEEALNEDIAAMEREAEKTVQRFEVSERNLLKREMEFEAQLKAWRNEQARRAASSPPPPVEAEGHNQLLDAIAQLAVLQRKLDDKESEALELKGQLTGDRKVTMKEIEVFEGDMNRCRQELEAERRRLEEEAEQVQARREEIDDLARTMELEMSRERAKLAHEGIEITRLRDEVRMDQDRARRNDGVRERFAGLQRHKVP